ncbi:hypothetical protein MKW94_025634 [Papaver nudicaule]|uniref:Electron transporter n=1 Tax=Papaver nudicaule TaxID=74823 RepID=A0AA41SLY3_PAPNU|nr:hypothetical protein [Papaver nudicaule]
MDVLNVDDDEDFTKTCSTTRESSVASQSHVHGRHRRSKSSSDKNLDVSAFGVLHDIQKSSNLAQHVRSKRRNHRIPSPSHPNAGGTSTNTCSLSNHRASLEKDIELLQLRLQQEKSMRVVLERAMGRASSTLSPGHRHVAAQATELIAEIELLEEEVANREHYVLSLYRNIFDNCSSGASTEPSSGMTSPAHSKDARKHPSVISSAFCSSSKKIPLHTFQFLTSIKDCKKKNVPLRSRTKHASMLGGRSNLHIGNTGPDPNKVQGKAQGLEKTSLARTLKDHLYQCPSKLSEELIRCMAAIYCCLQSPVSKNPEKNRSPLLSRSSTNVVLPRCSIREEREWSSSSTVEISCLSTDKTQFSRVSHAINNYRLLVEQLERVNMHQMGRDAQTAFWINVHNSLIMHAYLAYGIPHGPLRRLTLFHKAAYNIGGNVISANAIEHSIFCVRTPRLGWWFEAIISTALRKKTREDKQLHASKCALRISEPLVCFALCTGVSSDPVLRVYTATNIKEELNAAKSEFLQANVLVKKSTKVFLPKVLESFAKEANICGSTSSSDDLVCWVAENVDKKLQDSIRKCTHDDNNKVKRKASQIIEWLPYNTKFRYTLSKDMTEKSC